ncbi:MAG: SET domain-containing protein-lysine N-methyltransferase [Rhodomicrobiaceae bacterium]
MSKVSAFKARRGSQPEISNLDGPRIKVIPGISPGRGRGLFAAAHIARGEILERACTIHVHDEQTDTLEEILPLGDYYFRHPKSDDAGLIILGMASLCNHADEPNAHIRFEDQGELGWMAVLHALRDIAQGEEITYRYRCPLWFAPEQG